MKSIIFCLLFFCAQAFAGAPVIWGPDSSAKVIAPNGIWPSAQRGAHVFDDFLTGATNANTPVGALGWRNAGNAGGGLSGYVSGSVPTGILGHIGLMQPITGTTSNATGQGFLDLQSMSVWPGAAKNITMTCEIQTPAALAVGGGVDYVIEVGFGVYPYTASTNGAVIQYKRSASLNWAAYTSQNGVFTNVTSSVPVVAATWYLLKIVMTSGSVSFYVGAAGASTYTLIGTSTTNLPTSAFPANPSLGIYKVTTTTATSTSFLVDWCSLDYDYTALR